MFQISLTLHILAAMVWIGGMLFLALVIVPATRGLPPRERARFFDIVGRRFRFVGWISVGVLIVTGTLNAGLRGITWDVIASGAIVSSSYGQTLLAKLAVVAVMLVVTAQHDFVVGPASTRAAIEDAPELPRLRRQSSALARAGGILGVLVVALAVLLSRGTPP
ncbi:MAG: copper resistance protein CopD [Chloroflexota bacterium]|nr:MAG: copper resistance protein CopD [Chloroflexota bacterium]